MKPQVTPSWHREALAQGIEYIVLVYEKAEGFVFCPSRLERPFRVGGDYDGNWHVSTAGALDYYQRFFNQGFRDRVEWFIPFVEKVRDGEDFSLQDLNIEQRRLRVIQGRWPW